MKLTYILTLLCLFSSAQLFSQEKEEAVSTSGDTTRINMKKATIIIIDKSSDSTLVDKVDDDKESYYQHWSGFNMGFNMLVNDQMSIAAPGNAPYLTLNHGKSFQWQMNFAEKSFPIVGNYLQMSTGLGFDFRTYAFRNDFTLLPGSDTVAAFPSGFSLDKNNLNVSGFRVPLLLGINTSKDPEKGLHLTAGVIGAYNFSARLKQKYFDNGEKRVDKVRNAFNVNPWNLTAVAGVGVGDWIYLYSEYQLTSFFESGANPSVVPFTIGIRLLDFE